MAAKIRQEERKVMFDGTFEQATILRTGPDS
jgi:hypothetical protein